MRTAEPSHPGVPLALVDPTAIPVGARWREPERPMILTAEGTHGYQEAHLRADTGHGFGRVLSCPYPQEWGYRCLCPGARITLTPV
jgi:hypothetical protein